MPYKSKAQEAFFHTDTARKKGISAATVQEFDQASKGMNLPAHVTNRLKNHLKKRMGRRGR